MSGTSMKLLGSFPRYTVIVQPALFVSFRSEWCLHVVYILISRSMISCLTCCVNISVVPDILSPWHKPFLSKMAEHRNGSQGITRNNWWPFSHFHVPGDPTLAWSGCDEVFKRSACKCQQDRLTQKNVWKWNYVKFDLWTVRASGGFDINSGFQRIMNILWEKPACAFLILHKSGVVLSGEEKKRKC